MEYSEVTTLDGARSQSSQDNSPFLIFGSSWVAYLRLLPISFGGLMLISAGAFGAEQFQKSWLVYPPMVLAVAWFIYAVADIRAVKLFTDETGVWLFKGVFPWQKGYSGTKWADIGSAGYRTGFVSWALRSYRVEVEHRFTRTTELSVRHLRYGNLAVEHMNQIVRRLHGTRGKF